MLREWAEGSRWPNSWAGIEAIVVERTTTQMGRRRGMLGSLEAEGAVVTVAPVNMNRASGGALCVQDVTARRWCWLARENAGG